MNCAHPVQVWYDAGDVRVPGPLVPCGRCMACRKARAAEWSVRLMHELDSWSCGVFVTLTYNTEHLPGNGSLSKRDLQLYFKRVRRSLGDRRIKYYACGEYGTRYRRPHYHYIGFGLDQSADKEAITDAWRQGFVSIGSVTLESCRYVTNYVQKEDEAGIAGKDYGSKQAPFRLSSQKLGADYVSNNEVQILQHYYITVNGVKTALPRYYVKLLGDKIDKDRLNRLSIERAEKRERDYADEGIGVLEAWRQEAAIRGRKERELIALEEQKKKRMF